MGNLKYIFQDWKANRQNIKVQIVLACFRSAQLCRKSNKLLMVLFLPYLIFYRVFIEWILGIELPWKTQVGPNFKIYHGYALVVNDNTIIGKNCILRHSTTIGNKQFIDGTYSDCPVIGDNVDIGSNVVIIGPVKIGNYAIIGAGSVVVKDVPDYTTVAGNPARVIKSTREPC